MDFNVFDVIAFFAGGTLVWGAGLVYSWRDLKRRRKARADEEAQLIAMGEGMSIEYVPGEDIDKYRWKVIGERDRRAEKARFYHG